MIIHVQKINFSSRHLTAMAVQLLLADGNPHADNHSVYKCHCHPSLADYYHGLLCSDEDCQIMDSFCIHFTTQEGVPTSLVGPTNFKFVIYYWMLWHIK